MNDLFFRLSKSPFRSRFHLGPKEKLYIKEKGWETIRLHAKDFINKRIAPALILKDGKQTPMKGHPVFIAQHATATCCRSCLQKWHHIAKGKNLSLDEQEYIVNVIMKWLEKECNKK